MKNSVTAYSDTNVHWGKSQSDIIKLLNKHGIQDVQFTNVSKETAGLHGIEMDDDTIAVLLVFQKQEALPNGVHGNVPIRIIIPNVPNNDRRINQYYRVLFWYLKSKFEAIDTGLVEFAEEFMPHLQINAPNGAVGRLWDTFKRGYYKAIGSGEQGNAQLLPPMTKEDSDEEENNT